MDIGLKWIEREEFVILGKEIMQALRQNEGNVLEYKEQFMLQQVKVNGYDHVSADLIEAYSVVFDRNNYFLILLPSY